MDRRTLLKAVPLGWGLPRRAPAQPAPARLVAWMYMIYPREQWLDSFRRMLDAWEEGGVRGIVIGPLRFWDGPPSFDYTYRRAGAVVSTFTPDASIFSAIMGRVLFGSQSGFPVLAADTAAPARGSLWRGMQRPPERSPG